MEFQFQKISDYGTANPIVARLSIQTSDLCNFFITDQKRKDKILKTMGFDIQFKLLETFKIYDEMLLEIQKIDKEATEKGFNVQASGRVALLPGIVRLESRCDAFLYNAKNVLREILKLINVLWGTDFKGTRFDEAAKWFSCNEEIDKKFSEMLKSDHDLWIKRLIDMRNAAEHPEGEMGPILYKNITLVQINGQYKYCPPAWKFNTTEFMSIIDDMETTIDNLLRFSEDILTGYLSMLPHKFPLVFIEIPENERNPDMPVRIRMGMDSSKLGNNK